MFFNRIIAENTDPKLRNLNTHHVNLSLRNSSVSTSRLIYKFSFQLFIQYPLTIVTTNKTLSLFVLLKKFCFQIYYYSTIQITKTFKLEP